METTLALITFSFTALSAVLGVLLLKTKRSLAQQKESREYRTRHHRQLVGSTILWPGSNGSFLNYNLRSYDDGRTWVAVEFDEEWRMRILGDAEVVYPGLVRNLMAVDRLVATAERGHLDLSATRSQKLLEDAGFSVVATN